VSNWEAIRDALIYGFIAGCVMVTAIIVLMAAF